MKIVWTKEALQDIRIIYEYYKSNVSIKVAKKIRESILSSTRNLQKFPNKGEIEELLKYKGSIFRYLIADNYKIIYKVEDNIYIMKVFDCRQNPELIKKI